MKSNMSLGPLAAIMALLMCGTESSVSAVQLTGASPAGSAGALRGSGKAGRETAAVSSEFGDIGMEDVERPLPTPQDAGPTARIFIVRHGDRWDKMFPQWDGLIKNCDKRFQECEKNNGASSSSSSSDDNDESCRPPKGRKVMCDRRRALASDPSLSAIGHQQARETGAWLSEELKRSSSSSSVKLLVSPYLRAIQTSVPLAEALECPIYIEDGLAETEHNPDVLPTPEERFTYFPHIDFTYEKMQEVCNTEGRYDNRLCPPGPCEGRGAPFFQRITDFATKLSDYAENHGTVVAFSHGASVGLAAALTQSTIEAVGKLAPCGVIQLEKRPEDAKWTLVASGDTNHCTVKNSTTLPWTFKEKEIAIWNEQFLASQ